MAINRDTGDISLSPIYNNLILKDSFDICTQSNLREPINISNETEMAEEQKVLLGKTSLHNLFGKILFFIGFGFGLSFSVCSDLVE